MYKFENNPVSEDGLYKIRIVEFENEFSELQDFELIRVKHPEDVNIAVLDGEIVGYENEFNSNLLVDGKEFSSGEVIKRNKGEKAEIKLDDDYDFFVSKTALRGGDRRLNEVKNEFSESSDLNDIAKKIATIAGLTTPINSANAQRKPVLKSVHFQYILSGEGEKKEISVSHPRENFSTHIIKLLDLKGDKLTLEWTDTHKVAPIGFTNKVSDNKFSIEKQKVEEVAHSTQKEVELPTSLEPGEMISLHFPKFKETKKEETFILKSNGYYRIINKSS